MDFHLIMNLTLCKVGKKSWNENGGTPKASKLNKL